LAACRAEPELRVPGGPEVEAAYEYRGTLEATVEGGTAEIRIVQPGDQLRRGGALWAKVGPYVLLFSEETRDLFRAFGGLEAVRVVTENEAGREVARAHLHRDVLNELTWRRALNVAGKARKSGTERPSLLEDLVVWGEEHTDFRYSEAFVR